MSKLGGSIRDVARATGLSTATISRVVNNSGSVSADTRERVLAACELLDYLPNPAARALATARSRTIAAIIPTIEHSVFAKYIASIEKTLSAAGYSLVLAISNGDAEEEHRAARKLLGMGADAFILSGAAHAPELVELLKRRAVPFVFTSIWEPKLPYPTIGYDNRAIAVQACTYLAGRGHAQVAILHGPIDESDRTAARVAGAKDARSSSFEPQFIETELSVAGGKSAIQTLLTQNPNVSAVLCLSDVIALGVYFGLQAEGATVPQDMSIMGFDNLDWSPQIEPALTTIDLPASAMGKKVARSIVDHLELGTSLEQIELEAKLIERGSVINHPIG